MRFGAPSNKRRGAPRGTVARGSLPGSLFGRIIESLGQEWGMDEGGCGSFRDINAMLRLVKS